MSIFEVLGTLQREVEELFADITRQIGTSRELARVTFQRLSNKLIACMRAEHATLYPRLERECGLIDEVAQARREHDEIERAINRLRVCGLRGDAWALELAHLRTLVTRHSAREEFTLFPVAAQALDRTQLAQLAADFLAVLAMSATVAGPAITYEAARFEPPPPVVVRFRAA